MSANRLALALLSLTTLLGFGLAGFFWQQLNALQTAATPPPLASPYVAQLASSVRGLSPQEITDLSEGNGMGLARAAELNSYPGPRHLLDARQQLGLTPEQTAQIEAIWTPMNRDARALGLRILQGEQELEADFREQRITDSLLRTRLAELEAARTELRYVHLRAHLASLEVLTGEQVAHYNRLRGYAADYQPQHGSGHGH